MGAVRLFFHGQLQIRAYGRDPERFLNLCAGTGVTLYNMKRKEDDVCFVLSVPDFRRAVPLARKSRTFLHICRRSGLPFLLYRNRTRKAYAAGLLLGIFLLYFLSHFLWDVRFVGNLYYTDETIRDFLEEEGIQYGMWTNQIVCNDLEQAIRIRYPEITWVSAQISGTRMIIQMKENFSGTDSTEIKNVPGDLAAAEDGVITSMIVRQGTPLVKPGDEVKAGQVLVSGRIPIHDDSGEVVAEEETTADADVYAELSIPYVWEHSRYREERIVTGKYPCGISLRIGSYLLRAGRTEAQDGTFCLSETETPVLFYRFSLPLSLTISRAFHYETCMRRMTEEECQALTEKELTLFRGEIRAEGGKILREETETTMDENQIRAEGYFWIEKQIGEKAPFQEIVGEENENGISAGEASYDAE